MPYEPTATTLTFVFTFFFCYEIFLVRQSAKHTISLLDFAMLSSLAALPCLFVGFPRLAELISQGLGIQLPINLLFGLLLFVTFVYLLRLVSRINESRRTNLILVQELALLRHELDERTPIPIDSRTPTS